MLKILSSFLYAVITLKVTNSERDNGFRMSALRALREKCSYLEWSAVSRNRTEYAEILLISLYSL